MGSYDVLIYFMFARFHVEHWPPSIGDVWVIGEIGSHHKSRERYTLLFYIPCPGRIYFVRL